MRRWPVAFTAVLALVSTQPVLASDVPAGRRSELRRSRHRKLPQPEGITADAGGTLYAAGLSGKHLRRQRLRPGSRA